MPRDENTKPAQDSMQIRDRATMSVSAGVRNVHPVYLDRALNAEAWDVEGTRYIDFIGGIGVLTVGHRNPVVMERVAAQCELHTTRQPPPASRAATPRAAAGARTLRLRSARKSSSGPRSGCSLNGDSARDAASTVIPRGMQPQR